MKVLIADDSQIMRKIIKANLGKIGIEKVFECADGASASRMLAANTDTKLLFTDLNMPNLNGYDLIKKIRSIPQLKHLEIIVISDKLDDAAKNTLAAFDVTAYVPKPFNLTNFNETALPIIENIKHPRQKQTKAKPYVDDIANLLSKEQPALKLNADGLTAMFNDYTIKVPLDIIVKHAEVMEKKAAQ